MQTVRVRGKTARQRESPLQKVLGSEPLISINSGALPAFSKPQSLEELEGEKGGLCEFAIPTSYSF